MKSSFFKMLLCVAVFFCHMYGYAVPERNNVTQKELSSIKKIDIEIDQGNIMIKASERDDYRDLYCRYHPYRIRSEKAVQVYIDNKELKIRYDKKALKNRKRADFVQCNDSRVDFELCVPSHVDISVRAGNGDISVRGLTDNVCKLKIGNGRVRLDNMRSDVEVAMGNAQDLYIEYVPNNVHKNEKYTCELKLGNVVRGIIAIPSTWDVKNEIKGALYATKISNAFDYAGNKKPKVTLEGSIGSGKLDIIKK